MDYFVLLPAAYYESSILTKKIENPCELGNLGLCRHYKYPAIDEFLPTFTPFITNDNEPSKPTEFYSDTDHLDLIHEKPLPLLSENQPKLNYIVDVPRTGAYIVVIDYVTDRSDPESSIIRVNLVGEADDADGVVTLYPCTYTMVCRQPVIDAESREKIFRMDTTDLRPIEVIVSCLIITFFLLLFGFYYFFSYMKNDEPTRIAIKSVAIIPIEEWSIDMITPRPVCLMQEGKCVQSTFRTAPESKKVKRICNKFLLELRLIHKCISINFF